MEKVMESHGMSESQKRTNHVFGCIGMTFYPCQNSMFAFSFFFLHLLLHLLYKFLVCTFAIQLSLCKIQVFALCIHLVLVSEGTTAGQPLAIYRRLGRTGDEWRVGHVVLKKTLISSRMDGLILLYLLS